MIDHAMTGMPLPKTADSGNSAANDSIDEEKYENPDKVSGESELSCKQFERSSHPRPDADFPSYLL